MKTTWKILEIIQTRASVCINSFLDSFYILFSTTSKLLHQCFEYVNLRPPIATAHEEYSKSQYEGWHFDISFDSIENKLMNYNWTVFSLGVFSQVWHFSAVKFLPAFLFHLEPLLSVELSQNSYNSCSSCQRSWRLLMYIVPMCGQMFCCIRLHRLKNNCLYLM